MAKKKRRKSSDEALVPRLLAGQVLNNIIDLHTKYHIHTTRKIQFIAAIIGIILSITLSQVLSENFNAMNGFTQIGVIVIMSFSLFAILISLKAEEPEKMKESKHLHLLEYGEFTDVGVDTYTKELKKLLANNDEIIKEYAGEIYRLEKLLTIKTKKVRFITQIMLLGLLIGALLIVVGVVKLRIGI